MTEATAEGGVIKRKIAVPIDEEQKAATEGRVTGAQLKANQALGKAIATKMQQKLDTDLLPERKVRLQSGFEEVRKRAIAARLTSSIPVKPTNVVVEQKSTIKKGFLRKLLES